MLAAPAGAAATDESCTYSGEDVLPGMIMDCGDMTGTTTSLASPSTDCSDMEPPAACSDTLDPALRALHNLDLRAHAMKTTRSLVYDDLRRDERLVHPDAPHHEIGSPSSDNFTTDQKEI
jgi:hypothetical protein